MHRLRGQRRRVTAKEVMSALRLKSVIHQKAVITLRRVQQLWVVIKKTYLPSILKRRLKRTSLANTPPTEEQLRTIVKASQYYGYCL